MAIILKVGSKTNQGKRVEKALSGAFDGRPQRDLQRTDKAYLRDVILIEDTEFRLNAGSHTLLSRFEHSKL